MLQKSLTSLVSILSVSAIGKLQEIARNILHVYAPKDPSRVRVLGWYDENLDQYKIELLIWCFNNE